MDKISPNFYSILILLFSFWFSIFPAYLYFSTLDASDINSASSSLENIDEEDSTPNLDKKEKVAGSTFLIKHMFMGYLFLTQVPNLFFRLQTSDAKPLILRC
jgi:hypothetical protein